MNVVGKVGSLITQGVYSVATPFHPFGGAVDIIVVEQQDGTYRTTPWYVRFGKFQGVLRGAERIVRIHVNGVEAEFHMLLDNSGEAYFVREVESGSEDVDDEASIRVSQVDAIDGSSNDENTIDGSKEELVEIGDKSGYSSYHYENLEEVENVANSSEDSNSEVVLLSVDGHVLTVPISGDEENTENMQLSIPQFHLGPGEGSGQDFSATGDVWTEGLLCDLDSLTPKDTETYGMGSNPHGAGYIMSRNDTFRSCLDLVHIEEDGSESVDLSYVESEKLEGSGHSPEVSSSSNILVGQMAGLQDIVIGTKDFQNSVSTESQSKDDQVNAHVHFEKPDISCPNESLDKNILDIENSVNLTSGLPSSYPLSNDIEQESVQTGSSPKGSAVEEDRNLSKFSEFQRSISSQSFEISLCGNILHAGLRCNAAEEAFEAHRISKDEFKASGAAIIKNTNLVVRYSGKYFTWDKVAHIIVGMAVFGSNFSEEPKDPIPIEPNEIPNTREEPSGLSPSTSTGRWRLWPIPFRRVKSLRHTNSNNSSNEDIFLDSESFFQDPWPAHSPSSNSNHQSPSKQLLRTNIPTSEQIASLNLKDGQNMVAFSFSTRVLGKQQVDAHIYLWKWNAKIVISDVDGTITRSDVLGQVMHLVGKDWTQSGVARLFAAIKENGYQLLFLSARAIVQAYLTRSFLLNLKQDGRALPNGPVVISPDGLFPSLYREVIRRAPHEFKIACLQDIRALFPSDHNPFYAGFGNRDTDELTYRKIGIPKGKIFIINPKGEVAIHNYTDVKSYISLHTLVNDMFPPTSLAEQEDFNSWNYWKIPLPTID